MKIAYGRLMLSPETWGSMTLTEFGYAVDGFTELESERLRWTLYNTRKICYYVIAPNLPSGSTMREQDVFSIPELDVDLDKIRQDQLPISKVVQDGDA